jgi:hypothetical protein
MRHDSDSPLRNELDRILRESQEQGDQEASLEKIRKIHPHSIRPARLDDFCKIPDGNVPEYDCWTFALDLIYSQERIAVRRFAPYKKGPIQRPGIDDALPGPNFFCYLQLSKNTNFQNCRDHDLVVYFDFFGKAKHIGKVIEGSIVSKWGMKGYLWNHGIWEIPSSYGVDVRFYSQLDKTLIRKQWSAYLSDLAKRVKRFTDTILGSAQQQL